LLHTRLQVVAEGVEDAAEGGAGEAEVPVALPLMDDAAAVAAGGLANADGL
jgi:hypothetical protein